MLITGSLAGDVVPLEVDASCRTAAALKRQILREVPRLENTEAFDVAFQGAIVDDAAVCGLEEGCTVAIVASRSAVARRTLREQGREVSEAELFRAAEDGNVAVCELLLDAGVWVDCERTVSRDCDGDLTETPLTAAAAEHRSEVCALLLKRGCDREVLDSYQQPPIFSALGDVATCKVLLEGGCDVEGNRAAPSRCSPMDMACAYDDADIVALLLKHGAKTSSRAGDGDTPLLYCLHRHMYDTCRVLLEGGCDVEDCGYESAPIIMAAGLHGGDTACFSALLLEHGAKLSSRCKKTGETALDIAERQGNTELCALLRDHGCEKTTTPAS